MTDIRSLEQTLLENPPWNKARIKFVARFLLALYAVQSVNLSLLATAFSGHAQEESNYKRRQRFLRGFTMCGSRRICRQTAGRPRTLQAGAGSHELASRDG